MIQEEKTCVSIFVLDGKGGADIIDVDRLTPKHLSHPIWFHFNLSSSEAIHWLNHNLSLPDNIKENLTDIDLSDNHVHLHQNGLFFVVRSINMVPNAEPDDLVLLRLYVTQKMLITTRLHPAIDFGEIKELFSDKDGPKNTDELMIAVLENTLERISEAITGIENYVDTSEEEIIMCCFTSKTYIQLSEFLRQVIIIRRFMLPEREVIGNLIRHTVSWFKKDTKKGLQDCFEWLQRIIEDIDLLEKRIRVNQDAIQNQENAKMQRNMYMLTVVAGLFLPLSFLSGLFGMNLSGIPLGEHPYGFLIVCFVTVCVGLIVLFIFKKVKWI